jgi:hypothetical protein
VKEGKIRDRIREYMRWLKEVSQLTLAVLSTIPHFRVLLQVHKVAGIFSHTTRTPPFKEPENQLVAGTLVV